MILRRLFLVLFLAIAFTVVAPAASTGLPRETKKNQKKDDKKTSTTKKKGAGEKNKKKQKKEKKKKDRRRAGKKRRAKQEQRAKKEPAKAERPKEERVETLDIPEALPNLPAGWTWPPTDAMRADGERCKARLDSLGVKWRAGPEAPLVVTPVEIPGREIGGVRFKRVQRDNPPLVMDCRLAEAMAVAGVPILHAAGVRELRYSTLLSRRNVIRDGRRQPNLSRHALGLAVDVHVFVTDEGTEINVKEDYGRGLYLFDIEKRCDESGAFRDVITPSKDPRSHDNHFHFEARALGDPGDAPPVAPPAMTP